MIFDHNAVCRRAEVRETQGQEPLALGGQGLWAGVLSSGGCVLECAGQQEQVGAPGDLFLGRGGFGLRPLAPCHLLCVRLTGTAVEEFLRGLPGPRFADSAACPGAA